MIKLYGVPRSRAFRPLWMLRELGLEFDNVPTSFTGETRSAEFLKLNPNGHIPVLVDGEVVLWESLAINLYLARKYGADSLWPSTVADEGRTYQWSLWAMTELEPQALPVLMHRRALPKDQRKPDVADAAEAKLAAPLGVLEGALRTRPYLLGDRFGAADLNVASVAVWVAMSGVDLGKTPNVAAWLARCTERPACKAAQG
ncbi:MAG: glutathione S-transferase family protein [Deltaproteobacteria bacterium]|nr:glutathione S-transferase family protein [Deltaproteobacteria bacterium]